MADLPAVDRPRLAARSRRLVRAAWGRAPEVLWRLRHLADREPFAAGAEGAVRRVPYRAVDGAPGSLLALAPRHDAAGEPVALLPTLGLTPAAFLEGPGPRLVDRLLEAGFAPYLVDHRACREPGPRGMGGRADFDAVVDLDLPAALDAIAQDAGYPRVHAVGHGLGGQLWLGHAAVHAGHRLASVVLLAAPVRFDEGAGPGWLRRAAGGLPAGWRLPTAELARWTAALEEGPAGRGGPARRAVLARAGADVPTELAAQLAAWLDAGALVDRAGGRDYTAGLAGVAEPLLLLAGDGDALCPRHAALAVREAWRAGAVTVHALPDGFDHLDPLVHSRADVAVARPIAAWLDGVRLRAWRGAAPVDLGLGGRRT